jgi:hypothetical protein
MTLIFIPRGVLEKLERISDIFVWFGSQDKNGTPLVKWGKLARPKDLGG